MSEFSCSKEVPTPLRTTFDIVVCFLIPISYIPQFLKTIRTRSTVGISGWYLFLLSITSSTELASRLENRFSQVAFECVRSKQLRGWEAVSALLVFVQVIIHWLSAAAFFAFMMRFPKAGSISLAQMQVSPLQKPLVRSDLSRNRKICDDLMTTPSKPPTNRNFLHYFTTHAMIFIPVAFAILWVGRPDPDDDDWDYLIDQQLYHQFLAISGLLSALGSSVFQVKLMTKNFRDEKGVGSLSVSGLALQSMAFLWLAGSQALRLGWPRLGDKSQPDLTPMEWFLVVNGCAVGYLGIAVSQLVVLGVARRCIR